MRARREWALALVLGAAMAGAALAHDPNPDGDSPAIPTMADLAWIAGDWVSTNPDLPYTITETWSAPFHETMTGVARTVVERTGADADDHEPGKGEIVSTRTMIIRLRPDGLPVLFMRRMSGTLEDYPGLGAAFYPLMEWGNGTLTFENKGQSNPRSVRFERTGDDDIRITYTGMSMQTHKMESQPTDFRRRFAVAPDSPLIARAMLFRSLLEAGKYDAARAMMGDSPRIARATPQGGTSEPWTIGPEQSARAAWDRAFRTRTEIVDWTATDESASVTTRETDDYDRALDQGWGVTRTTYFFDADHRITRMRVEALTERPAGKADDFLAWASEHHPDEIAVLMPGGRPDPSADHAARLRALLIEWRADAGLPPLD